MFTLSSRQCHCVHKYNTIGLSSVCVATVFVPKVESGERADVSKVRLGEQRVKQEMCSLPWVIPERTTPGTGRTWRWWWRSGCSRSATPSSAPASPSSRLVVAASVGVKKGFFYYSLYQKICQHYLGFSAPYESKSPPTIFPIQQMNRLFHLTSLQFDAFAK